MNKFRQILTIHRSYLQSHAKQSDLILSRQLHLNKKKQEIGGHVQTFVEILPTAHTGHGKMILIGMRMAGKYLITILRTNN